MILGVFGPWQMILVLIFIAVFFILPIFHLINLQDLLKQVSNKNRLVPAVNVWLMLIPLFNLVYPFILYPKICDSVKLEYEDRGIIENGDFSRGIALALPILTLCSFLPFIGVLAGIANLVLFILFWVKTAEYKEKLRKTLTRTVVL